MQAFEVRRCPPVVRCCHRRYKGEYSRRAEGCFEASTDLERCRCSRARIL